VREGADAGRAAEDLAAAGVAPGQHDREDIGVVVAASTAVDLGRARRPVHVLLKSYPLAEASPASRLFAQILALPLSTLRSASH
jgi:hypothetical protein